MGRFFTLNDQDVVPQVSQGYFCVFGPGLRSQGPGYIGVTRNKERISSPFRLQQNPIIKGASDMSIDRFIIKKLDSCQEEHTRRNLVKLFKLRIQKAEKQENKTPERIS
ncbi:hypothetical protein D3C73_1053060 [compost metagenome]